MTPEQKLAQIIAWAAIIGMTILIGIPVVYVIVLELRWLAR